MELQKTQEMYTSESEGIDTNQWRGLKKAREQCQCAKKQNMANYHQSIKADLSV
jgi:hypothetical protein